MEKYELTIFPTIKDCLASIRVKPLRIEKLNDHEES